MRYADGFTGKSDLNLGNTEFPAQSYSNQSVYSQALYHVTIKAIQKWICATTRQNLVYGDMCIM